MKHYEFIGNNMLDLRSMVKAPAACLWHGILLNVVWNDCYFYAVLWSIYAEYVMRKKIRIFTGRTADIRNPLKRDWCYCKVQSSTSCLEPGHNTRDISLS